MTTPPTENKVALSEEGDSPTGSNDQQAGMYIVFGLATLDAIVVVSLVSFGAVGTMEAS